MKTVTEWIRNHIERTVGISEPITWNEIQNHVNNRLDPNFDSLRNSRIAMGYIRYESLVGKSPRYVNYIYQALCQYQSTGNREYLVDLAFYVAAEWVTPSYQDTHFTPTDHPE